MKEQELVTLVYSFNEAVKRKLYKYPGIFDWFQANTDHTHYSLFQDMLDVQKKYSGQSLAQKISSQEYCQAIFTTADMMAELYILNHKSDQLAYLLPDIPNKKTAQKFFNTHQMPFIARLAALKK